jgi:hypothetical protein
VYPRPRRLAAQTPLAIDDLPGVRLRFRARA